MSGSRKPIIIVVAIIVLAVGLVITVRNLAGRRPGNIVTASGTIEAIEVDVSPRVAGRIVKLTVDEGSTVKKGQIIAVLNADELNARVQAAQGALIAAEAKLSDLLKGTREERIREARANYESALANARGAKEVAATAREAHSKSTELKANLAVARADYKSALQDYNALEERYAIVKKGPRSEEIANLKANVAQVRARYTDAETDYVRYQQLYQKSAISAQQLDNARATRDAQKAALESAEEMYKEGLNGSRPEEIREAKARVDQASVKLTGARDVLSTAKQAYEDRLDALQHMQSTHTTANTASAQVSAAKADLDLAIDGSTVDEIKNARGLVDQARGSLAEAKANLKQTTVLAPEDGVVLTKFRENGEVLTSGTPIVRIANLENVWLRVNAPLPTLGRIKTGQEAIVSTDSYKGKTYKGTVSSIKEEPEFTPKNVQTTEERVKLVYAIRIDLKNRQRELKPGMPADAEIVLNSGSGLK